MVPITTATLEHSQRPRSLIDVDEIAEQAKNLKPVANATEPKSPRRPSNAPIYAAPWKLNKRGDKDSKSDKIGASQEKSGESPKSVLGIGAEIAKFLQVRG